MRKKLNNLRETSDDNDDSEDNQISNFVDRVLKKVSKEILNDDNKTDDNKNDDNTNDDNKNDDDDNKKLLKLSKQKC